MAEGGCDISQTFAESIECYGDGIDPSISNWIKGKRIGRGSSASVFEVELKDGRFPNKLAVKEIKISNTDLTTTKTNIDAEKAILKELKHRRIVQVYSMHEHDFSLYILMGKCSRGTLANYVNEHTSLDEDTTRKFTLQILEGVLYLHTQKCIHRDIKGANILLDIDLSILLADFGTAKLLLDLTSASTTNVGTWNWTAPEVFQGPRYNAKADIWSVGCTVVEMLTGKPPFSGYEPGQIISKHLLKEDPVYTLPPSTSKEVKWFLDTTFQKDPSNRPPADVLIKSSFIIGTPINTNSSEDIQCDAQSTSQDDSRFQFPNINSDGPIIGEASSGTPNQGADNRSFFSGLNSDRPVNMHFHIDNINECYINIPRVSEPPGNDNNTGTNSTHTGINIRRADIVAVDSVVNRKSTTKRDQVKMSSQEDDISNIKLDLPPVNESPADWNHNTYPTERSQVDSAESSPGQEDAVTKCHCC